MCQYTRGYEILSPSEEINIKAVFPRWLVARGGHRYSLPTAGEKKGCHFS